MAALNQAVGEIQTAIRTIRRLTDTASVRAKYKDSDIVELLQEAWQVVIRDLYSQAQNPPLATYDITLVDRQRYYQLPANIGEIVRIANYSTTGSAGHRIINWELLPEGILNPSGYGIAFEGAQRMAVHPNAMLAEKVITIDYIPSASAVLTVGTTGVAAGASASTITLDIATTTDILGAIDRRQDVYRGSFLGILDFPVPPEGYSRFPIQQRIIKAYDVATGLITVAPDFDFDISTLDALVPDGLITYEIYPIEAPLVWSVLTRHVARLIAGFENNTNRFRLLGVLEQQAKAACIATWADWQSRKGNSMNTYSVDNPDAQFGIN